MSKTFKIKFLSIIIFILIIIISLTFTYIQKQGIITPYMKLNGKDMKIEINAIVNKNEYIQLINYINKVDPKAFVTVYNVNECRIQPKL